MAGKFQLRRGSTAQNNAFTGAEGEVTYDTEVKNIRVHDGQTQGGFPVTTINAIMPDYTRGINISSGATSTVYGWFYISGHSYSSSMTVSLNGAVVYTGGNFGNERLSNTCILFVKPGDVISWAGWNAQVSMATIYPCGVAV